MYSAGVHVDGTEALAEQRLRMLRAFRAAAAQLLDALLRHMLQGLHGPSLATVLLELQVCCCRSLCSLTSGGFPRPCYGVVLIKSFLHDRDWGVWQLLLALPDFTMLGGW